MPLTAILLRALLSLSLLLNGSGNAFASVHLMAGHGDAGAASAQSITEPDPRCHESGEGMVDTVAHHSTEANPDVSRDASGQSGPDCCKSGACRCACMHGSVAATPMVVHGAIVPEHDTAVRRLASAHAAPVLPHLIRPPIG